ncbi:MAG: HdeA/HdeB family chaperone [Xenococcaceae cyanobacterium MO_167.B27]|nr:HdeA/HdeB family chaperone [Xenococcaceae cyanobacterium MO_167.B27]
MNQLKWIAVLSTAFLFSIPSVSVYGQNGTKQENDSTRVNLESLDCRYLLKLPGEDKEATMIYLHGFMSGKNSELIVDVEKLSEASEKIIDRCINRPNESLLRVFERYHSN